MNPIRLPAFADDRWYPSHPLRLQKVIEGYLQPGEARDVFGVMCPHAGYTYSGHVAGAAYGQINVPDRVILLGPNHRGGGAPLSIMTRGAWRIPGHDVPIDHHAADVLVRHAPELTPDEVAHQGEHSLELQLPFLVARNPAVSIVPICFYPLGYDDCVTLGKALASAIEELPGPTLIVASSDMNHFDSAAVGHQKDQRALARLVSMDPEGLFNTVRQERISMCGVVPATILLHAAIASGRSDPCLIKYADSGDITGDKSSVVGYASVTVG